MTDLPDFMTLQQVMKYLQISDATARRMLKDGRLRGTKIGPLWRIPREAVEELIRAGYAAQDDSEGRT